MIMSQTGVSDSHWPPRSPHEVLLSTPGGRDRLRRLAERTSPSPSPIKRSNSTPVLRNQPRENFRSTADLHDLREDDEEDEETLQLQLQEIQARLRLKKLQKSKANGLTGSDVEPDSMTAGSNVELRQPHGAGNRLRNDGFGSQRQRLEPSKPSVDVHVPLSPARRVKSTEPPRSPGRVLLGIDKGLKGRDVSLRRAPSLRQPSDERVVDSKRTEGYLQRANSQTSTHRSVISRASSSMDDKKPKSFSERMADVRTQEAERREREARIKRTRSKAFDIDADEMEGYKSTAADLPVTKAKAPEFSREQIMNSYNKPVTGILQRSRSTPALTSETAQSGKPKSSTTSTNASNPKPSSLTQKYTGKEDKAASSEFEPFSSLHLSKRIIPHNVLTRTLSGKKTYTIPDLLRVVKGPNFSLPEIEEDLVLLAVVASKSEPKQHKLKATNSERGKYMVMTLTDLKWELDMFLFNTGFDKFWKLTTGTVIAILNPSLMAPMKADTGRFSLTLNSSDDTVLEIGKARDLGFCKSVKKDGKTCDSWIDGRHTEYCEFHINETLKKTTAGRMEVNTMNFGKKRGDWAGMYGARKFNSTIVRNYDEKPTKKTSTYDRETKSRIYVGASQTRHSAFVGGPGRSTADLLDDADVDPDAFHRGSSKEERMRRHLATAEKERDIARKLGMVGGGLGADYLRMRDQPQPASSSTIDEPPEPPPDAASLGLAGGQAKQIHLSPVKRKRAGTSTPTSTAAMGWGGHLTKELGRMKDGERLQPVKKKTRFVTAKGIREAGRESFGGELPPPVNDSDEDDDDDLDIIK